MTTETESTLTDTEIERLILAVVNGQGTASEDDFQAVVKWAHHIRVGQAALDLVFQEKVDLLVDPEKGIMVQAAEHVAPRE